MRSLIDTGDLSVQEIDELILVASDISEHPEKYADACRGKKLATLFFEPSTRTRLSFTAAMMELGGNVLGFSDASTSSAAKGESIADTVRVVSCYADIIAMRSPKEGAALAAAESSLIPIINAGDGGHAHPTQTLADLMTISKEKGSFDGLTVGFCGDLKYGRTVHSLIGALSRYKNIRLVLISPQELKLPGYVMNDIVRKAGMKYEETENLENAIPDLDVLYMTRIQKERFTDSAEYERLKNSYVLTAEKLDSAKSDMIVMHPLPRVNEISVKVDKDPRACYFKQVANGKFMRMALILRLLSEAREPRKEYIDYDSPDIVCGGHNCANPKCITQTEQELENVFHVVDKEKGTYRCVYCEKKLKF